MKSKNRFFNRIMMMLLMVALTVFIMSGVAYADKDIDDAKNERDKTQEELDEVNATIEELAAEQIGIEGEIEEISCALVQVLAEIEVIEQQITDKKVEIDQCVLDYEAAVETEKEQYEAMKIRIKYLYENGNKDMVTIFMESGDIAEALTRADYIEELYKYDRRMLDEYKEIVQQVNDLHEQLLTEEAELEALQNDYVEEQVYMEDVMKELQAVADDYGAQIASARAQASEYAKKIEKQNAEIARLEEEARKKAEEEARKKAEEEARKKALEQVAQAQDTGVVKTTNSSSYDVSSINSAAGSDLGKSVATFACQFIGNPYVAGGTSLTNGADCSGFVFSVYKNFGYTVPRTSYALRSYGTEVSYDEAQPGDVVCYPGHVGIYIGNGMIVHASTERTGIKVSNAQYRSIASIRRII